MMTNPARSAHFARLNQTPRPALGWRWEIPEEIYDYFANVTGGFLRFDEDSFYCPEFEDVDITTKYTRKGDRYFCEFAKFPGGEEARNEMLWPEAMFGGLGGLKSS